MWTRRSGGLWPSARESSCPSKINFTEIAPEVSPIHSSRPGLSPRTKKIYLRKRSSSGLPLLFAVHETQVKNWQRRASEGLCADRSTRRFIRGTLLGLEMTTGSAPKTQLVWRGIVGLLGLFAGLCTIFALVVSVAEGLQEHAQQQWPETTARVDKCGLHQSSSGRRDQYYIDCRLTYTVGAEEFVTKIYSGSVPSPTVWQYPPNQIGPLQDWVDNHPQGTPIAVHYNPTNPKKAVLVATDMPRGGPHTPNNLKLLGMAATSCVLLLTIARITRPRPSAVGAERDS
jgi:hypothetical protein